jgi:hypothetical protein
MAVFWIRSLGLRKERRWEFNDVEKQWSLRQENHERFVYVSKSSAHLGGSRLIVKTFAFYCGLQKYLRFRIFGPALFIRPQNALINDQKVIFSYVILIVTLRWSLLKKRLGQALLLHRSVDCGLINNANSETPIHHLYYHPKSTPILLRTS